MKLSDKIVRLRKAAGMSQEELAEKLQVSRQAVSRWEVGTAMPDAANILQLSQLFCVTADYLLNEAYQSDEDLPRVRAARADGLQQAMVLLATLEGMALVLQVIAVFLLQSMPLGVLSIILFIAIIGGFEYACRKRAARQDKETARLRGRFYRLSAWLGLYFPIRFVLTALMQLYPRPYRILALEGIILAVYVITAVCISWAIEQQAAGSR